MELVSFIGQLQRSLSAARIACIDYKFSYIAGYCSYYILCMKLVSCIGQLQCSLSAARIACIDYPIFLIESQSWCFFKHCNH